MWWLAISVLLIVATFLSTYRFYLQPKWLHAHSEPLEERSMCLDRKVWLFHFGSNLYTLNLLDSQKYNRLQFVWLFRFRILAWPQLQGFLWRNRESSWKNGWRDSRRCRMRWVDRIERWFWSLCMSLRPFWPPSITIDPDKTIIINNIELISQLLHFLHR